MYGFPQQLYPIPQGMFDDQSPAFGASIDRQIFYSIKDGNWSDMSVWETVSQKVGRLPTANDMVYVRNSVVVNITTAACFHMYVSGTLSFNVNGAVSVFGNIKSMGLIDMTSSGSKLTLYGLDNYIYNLLSGLGTIIYKSNFYQNIMDLPYYNITLDKPQNSPQFIGFDIRIANNLLVMGSILDIEGYNLTVNGTTSLGEFLARGATLLQSGFGNILFIGQLIFIRSTSSLILNDNSTVELRGGILLALGSTITTGIGTLLFTTNNQAIAESTAGAITAITINRNVVIDNISLSITGINSSAYPKITFNQTIDGTTSGSQFINNGGWIILNAVSKIQMQTFGTKNINTLANSTVEYDINATYSPEFASYVNLVFNTGNIQLLPGNAVSGFLNLINCTVTTDSSDLTVGNLNVSTTPISQLICNSNLTVGTLASIGSLILGNYNLAVTTWTEAGSGLLSKLGAGTITSLGEIFTLNGKLTTETYSFNVGDGVTIEIASGLIFGSSAVHIGSGSLVRFKTNDQKIGSFNFGSTFIYTINAAIEINGIKLTATPTNATPATQTIIFTNTVNGTDSSSWFISKGGTVFHQNAQRPMIIGVLDCNTNANIFKYNMAGNQDVTGGTYRTLEFGGSGVKTLQGNVVVNTTAGGSWSITGTATVNMNGFTITTI